ncbi:hypothetical protein AMECASPLE_025022 [Ameca splendens]|uniref:Uncharacterized protein n=1 Tax=Ameca splendens TaxID=208324 RepID=A0ABV0XTG1_9TELE
MWCQNRRVLDRDKSRKSDLRKKRAWTERFKKGRKTKKNRSFFLIPYSVLSQQVFTVCFDSIPRWIQ